MAELLGILAGFINLLEASKEASRILIKIIGPKQYSSLKRSYGPTIALLITVYLRDTATQYERVESVILPGEHDDVLAFRQAVTDECNMTAVAGAIIAQVAITGLSLPNLSLTHWVARAFFLFAVTSGCLSVYYCCVLQRTIGKLYSPQLIKSWLSLPPEKGSDTSASRASLPAIFILSAPFTMMKASIFAFLIGLAIYQGFTWKRALDSSAGHDDSRDVFIAFMIGTGACLFFFSLTFSSKIIENILQFGRGDRYATNSVPVNDSRQRQPMVTTVEHPMHPRQGVNTSTAVGGLSTALETAAQAHIRCAEADRIVALEYSRASQARRNGELRTSLPPDDIHD